MHRQEYPRPDFQRDQWLSLNGQWDFQFDDENIGLKEHWEKSDSKFNYKIQVPFAFQSELSGIKETGFHDNFWYKRKITIPSQWENIGNGKNVILNFGAVDYRCKVFVNGYLVKEHEGGHIPFSCNITNLLSGNENDITVYVNDPSEDEFIPRGKQDWLFQSHSIWYTRTSGIWQSVWIELVDDINFDYVKITPDLDKALANFEITVPKLIDGLKADILITFKDEVVAHDLIDIKVLRTIRSFEVMQNKIFNNAYHNAGWSWTPETPNLFDVKLKLFVGDNLRDEINTYFGMRKIHTEKGVIFLNNRPYYQKLVLDQGYWPEGLLTAPKDEDFIKDIEYAKKMGFNGCRKHQKIEDPRFLYWADKMGFLVWGELPACPMYSDEAVKHIINEMTAEIKRDYNHPCIVAWVPLNESWGVPHIAHDAKQQNHSQSLYYTIKSIDLTRPVISNDGWEMTVTDICGIHNYSHGTVEQSNKFEEFKYALSDRKAMSEYMEQRFPYAGSFKHQGEPFMLTEFGGVGCSIGDTKGWGYTVATTSEELLSEYKRIIDVLYNSTALAGFCYTQLTDVEQEINGLLTYDRKPKCDFDKIKAINDSWRRAVRYE